MIVDTTFLIDYFREGFAGRTGRARAFLAANHRQVVRTSIVSIGEIAPSFETSAEVWAYFHHWRVYRVPGLRRLDY